jgi:hypothetical protein
MPVISKMKFSLGKLVATPGALAAITESGQHPWDFIVRHMAGDWGDVDQEDKAANDQALEDCSRLLSAYTTAKGKKLWIITEADRSATTILLRQEY